jgi:hypothetical protein
VSTDVSTHGRDTPVRDTARVHAAAEHAASLLLLHVLDASPWTAGFLASALTRWLREHGATVGPEAVEALAYELDFTRVTNPEEDPP